MRYLLFSSLLLFPLLSDGQELPTAETTSLKDPKEIIDLQLKSLDNLINLTQTTLGTLTSLRKEIVNYQIVQDLYLERPSDKELLYKMTKMAFDLLTKIKSSHLTHAFDTEFIGELSMLGRIYQKHELPQL